MTDYFKINKNSGWHINSGLLTHVDMNVAAKAIYDNKADFEEFERTNSKLAAVKLLKELTGFGLKEAKMFMDLVFSKEIEIASIREDRKEKLERLAKNPLAKELAKKMKNVSEEDLVSSLMKLTIDELFSIEEKLDNN